MKAQLKFNLDKEEDRITFSRIEKIDSVYVLLWTLRNQIRQKVKYEEHLLTEPQWDAWKDIQETFYMLLDEYKIDIEED
jgi:hypothetical protein